MMEGDQQLKVENKKSTKSDHDRIFSKEYIRALRLLHSPDTKSAEELRLMLELEIAKQNRPKRSSKARTTNPRRSKRRKSVNVQNECSAIGKSLQKNINGGKIDTSRGLNACVEDGANKDDIPRISIPDEDQNEGAVCKVCNFPEFGPLILTQCNTCEKYYHPLCHQPPILDMNFQESNSNWHCGECRKKDQS